MRLDCLGGALVKGRFTRHRDVAGALAASLVICLFAGCRDVKLQAGDSELKFRPEALEFGFVYRGAESHLSVSVFNASRGRINVTWDDLPEPFFAEALPSKLEVGENEITLRFRPTEWGERMATLNVRDGNTILAKLPLRGVGQDIPECPTPVACHEAFFDLAAGECQQRPLTDGTSCDPGSVCVLEASCRGGACVGEAKSCDDGNACTLDLCNPLSGCESTPAPPCPSIDECTVGVCDPQTGCGVEQAEDGTVCGDVTCDSADVCISGACVNRDPPDGFRCAEPSPCSAEGVCQASSCVQPPPSPLTATWSFNANTAPLELHDLLIEPDGSTTLTGFYEKPLIRANHPTLSRAMSAGVRRCILWNGRMVCADHLANGATGTVSLIDLATANSLWSFSLTAARPDFAALVAPGRMFMARLAVLGPDRLMALFEAYPKGSPPDTQCRLYFLVILNAAGQMVFAEKLVDPSLETCDHPHPFGVAADVSGNVYLAFSDSTAGTAPLSATAPTTLFSFSRDGALRWRRTETFVAGELAVSRGVLFPERSTTAFNANTGAPLALGGGQMFGRVIATTDLFVPSTSQLGGGSVLTAYRMSGPGSAWSYTLPTGATFVSPELRAVSFKASAGAAGRTAALAFVNDTSGVLSLHAVDLANGKKRWACPVEAPGASTPPQLFEVANDSIATMDSSMSCGDCDPPFALSSGYFRSYRVPGIGAAYVPWPGTYGGAGHSHRETPVYSAGTQQ